MAMFVAVARAQSFAGAARAMRLPKSTVSQRIAELEDHLGTKLFFRTTRRVRLTDAGAAYFPRCSSIIAEAEEANRMVAELEKHESGTLRINAVRLFAQMLLPGIVAEYAARHPGIAVEVMASDRPVDLVEEKIDIAIRAGPPHASEAGLVSRALRAEPHHLCASWQYVSRRPAPTTPEELAVHDCILHSVIHGSGKWRLQSKKEVIEVPLRSRVRSDSMTFIRECAREGMGIALLPAFFVAADIAENKLVHLLPEWSTAPNQVRLVFPQNRYMPRRVRAFIDVAASHFKKEPR
jgi:DNA-binding transcriptional LysR family regulator